MSITMPFFRILFFLLFNYYFIDREIKEKRLSEMRKSDTNENTPLASYYVH